ncbi:MAG: nucleotide 5'-monophosphate nucleosidase PpnN [Pseudomonadota bacterium]
MANGTVNTRVTPAGTLELLSQLEVEKLRDTSATGLHDLFRRCSLAVLNCGVHTDDAAQVMAQYRDFDIEIIKVERGIKLQLTNAPGIAFVDGEMITGIREHLFSVLRDVLYAYHDIQYSGRFDMANATDITNAVFHLLRNARIFKARTDPDIAVCWGGHSIDRTEYLYTKEVGYELGLRGLNVCTGCGPGAMKGPMKGATIGHAKQRISGGRYIGISEPGIIAAESPNPIVNDLVIMPDIEKRLEAFVRAGHGIIVFPGGAGTAEEILYLLGILLHPDNRDMPLPLVFTGPRKAKKYFEKLDRFIGTTLGDDARDLYRIIIDDAPKVAKYMKDGFARVKEFRRDTGDAYYFNWHMTIQEDFQRPFHPTHENMASLNLHKDQEVHDLAANLRRAFSGIVAGNVKEFGLNLIAEHGPYELKGDVAIMDPLDDLLQSFVAENRMKLAGSDYEPCYRLVS